MVLKKATASEVQVNRWLRVVGNIGAERNPDKEDSTPAAFVLGGFIFPVSDFMDLDFGVKRGLTEAESDYAIMAGVAFRF